MGTSKPRVVETKVAHRFGSKASLALEGRMVPSHERGFKYRSRALALSACSSRAFISTRRLDSRTVALCFRGKWSWRCSSKRVLALW
jgi:hypothetical protein